jgi:hypothetical protein
MTDEWERKYWVPDEWHKLKKKKADHLRIAEEKARGILAAVAANKMSKAHLRGAAMDVIADCRLPPAVKEVMRLALIGNFIGLSATCAATRRQSPNWRHSASTANTSVNTDPEGG